MCVCVCVCVCEVCVCVCIEMSSLLYTQPQNMPAWKRNLVKRRRDEQAVADAAKQQQQEEWEGKMAEIAAMPTWRRKIFLERNPQYRTD